MFPDKSCFPNVNELDSTAVNTSPEDGLTEETERGLDPDNSASNVEEYEEEEIIENESEVSEQEVDVEADVETDVETDVEANSANADDDVSSEEGDEEPSQSEPEQIRRESEQDQDVFKALDEAERADNQVFPPKGVPATPKADSVAENEDKDAPKEGGSKRKFIIFGLIFFVCVAIVAIVLPFYLDYPSGKLKGETSTNDPKPPSSVTTMKPESSKPTSNPTDSPTETPTTVQWAQFLTTFLIPISGEEVFKDENSPQYRAAKYILDDPYTALTSTTGRLEDRYASITFYFATEGENWKSCYFGDANCDSGQWLVDDVCDWYAVSCDDDGRVSSFLFGKL